MITHKDYKKIEKTLRWSTWLLFAQFMAAGGLVYWVILHFKK